jgi:hypothetical protein
MTGSENGQDVKIIVTAAPASRKEGLGIEFGQHTYSHYRKALVVWVTFVHVLDGFEY